MSYADEVFIRNCRDILTHGVWDTDQAVRPTGRTTARRRTRSKSSASSTAMTCPKNFRC